MSPVITIWQQGMAIPADLPSGSYTIIYRVNKLAAAPALINAVRMVGKLQPLGTGGETVKITHYRVIDRWFSPNVDFQFDAEIVGGAVAGVVAAIAAIAIACGIVAIFTNANMVEIRKVLTSPAGQEFLSDAGEGVRGIGGYLSGTGGVILAIAGILTAGAIGYAIFRKKGA